MGKKNKIKVTHSVLNGTKYEVKGKHGWSFVTNDYRLAKEEVSKPFNERNYGANSVHY